MSDNTLTEILSTLQSLRQEIAAQRGRKQRLFVKGLLGKVSHVVTKLY